MVYNESLIANASNIGEMASFVNVNSSGMFFVLFILTLTAIIFIVSVKNNMREFKAIFFSLSLTLIPTVLLAMISEFSTPLIPPWFVVLHITLFAASGAFAYLSKN